MKLVTVMKLVIDARNVSAAARISCLLLPAMFTDLAWGQAVVVNYAPLSAFGVPTLPPEALILLSVLLACSGYFALKWRGAGRFLGGALLAVAASFTLGSALVSRDAWALAYSPTLLDQAPGGSTTVSGYGVHTVHNSTGTTQRLMGLTPDVNTIVGGSSTCTVGSSLAPGGECTLNLVASCAVTMGPMQSGTPPAAKAWGC